MLILTALVILLCAILDRRSTHLEVEVGRLYASDDLAEAYASALQK